MLVNGFDNLDMSLTRYESAMARSLLAVEIGNADGIAVRSSYIASTYRRADPR